MWLTPSSCQYLLPRIQHLLYYHLSHLSIKVSPERSDLTNPYERMQLRIWLLLLSLISWRSWQIFQHALLQKLLHLSKKLGMLSAKPYQFRVILTQIMPSTEIECQYYQCHQISTLPNITFTPKDVLVKSSNHGHPFYYTRYIGSTKVERILIDSGSALIIMSVGLL